MLGEAADKPDLKKKDEGEGDAEDKNKGDDAG